MQCLVFQSHYVQMSLTLFSSTGFSNVNNTLCEFDLLMHELDVMRNKGGDTVPLLNLDCMINL